MIRIKDLVKSFQGAKGEVHALRGVSFEVSKGQLFTLLGPSGCGKTTTLRCIAGLEQPLAGEISVNDRPVFSASNKTLRSAGTASYRNGLSVLCDLASHDGFSKRRLSVGQRHEP